MSCRNNRDKYVQCLQEGSFVPGPGVQGADVCLHPNCEARLKKGGKECSQGHSQLARTVAEAYLEESRRLDQDQGREEDESAAQPLIAQAKQAAQQALTLALALKDEGLVAAARQRLQLTSEADAPTTHSVRKERNWPLGTTGQSLRSMRKMVLRPAIRMSQVPLEGLQVPAAERCRQCGGPLIRNGECPQCSKGGRAGEGSSPLQPSHRKPAAWLGSSTLLTPEMMARLGDVPHSPGVPPAPLCPSCNRPLTASGATCLFCGESLDLDASPADAPAMPLAFTKIVGQTSGKPTGGELRGETWAERRVSWGNLDTGKTVAILQDKLHMSKIETEGPVETWAAGNLAVDFDRAQGTLEARPGVAAGIAGASAVDWFAKFFPRVYAESES